MTELETFTGSYVSVPSTHPADGVDIFVRRKGEGEGLLLLHGYPQTGRMWHKIANRLAERYTVIIPDLRGYGKSSKPHGSESHIEYSKRVMAHDMVEIMDQLGFPQFSIAGHDRGGRVAHRLTLDYPDKVKRLMVLDIAPTLFAFDNMTHKSASDKWHWLLLSQETPHIYLSLHHTAVHEAFGKILLRLGEPTKPPIPTLTSPLVNQADEQERFILSQPRLWWDMYHDRPTFSLVKWSDDDVDEYRAGLETEEGVHATIEDYRAAATIDLEYDRESQAEGRVIDLPKVYVVSGNLGHVKDASASWKGSVGPSTELVGIGLESGHYVAEERPGEVFEAIVRMMEE